MKRHMEGKMQDGFEFASCNYEIYQIQASAATQPHRPFINLIGFDSWFLTKLTLNKVDGNKTFHALTRMIFVTPFDATEQRDKVATCPQGDLKSVVTNDLD